jgi:acyl-[acyl carrier protein]--UDP-N-acetylglucosamine O-acyltransferase
VRINAFVTVDAGLERRTTVGARTFLLTKVHVGHDAVVGADCELATGSRDRRPLLRSGTASRSA